MIKAIGEKTWLRVIEPENVTKGGIIIPDTAEKISDVAVVVAAGPLSDVKEGDMVWFYKYAGQEVEHNGMKCRVVKNKDLLGVAE